MRNKYIKSIWCDDEEDTDVWDIPIIDDIDDDELVDEYVEEMRVGFRNEWFQYHYIYM